MQTAVNHIVSACHHAGIRNIIICPGSRNAPLTMGFVRSGFFQCRSVIDERSAGFIALGMALESKEVVVLVCTSGSAVVNFYPAITEAFYLRIPLLVITADRPPELIDKWDGQTIRQTGIFGSHVKGSYITPDTYGEPEKFAKITLEAIYSCKSGLQGPVHINVPLREPLYPAVDFKFHYPEIKYWQAPEEGEEKTLCPHFEVNEKILVLFGMSTICCKPVIPGVPLLKDVLSNAGLGFQESILMVEDKELKAALRPDVLITAGTSVLSKNVKKFIREYKPKRHYHFSGTGDVADAFDSEPILIKQDLENWLKQNAVPANNDYFELWERVSKAVSDRSEEMLSEKAGFNEFIAAQVVLKSLPENITLHLANSMPVRYAALSDVPRGVKQIFSNRGTSGIDGCVSTALGASVLSEEMHALLVGDIAFFYDSNALWNNLPKSKLRIILLNNGGGGIFRLIEGPATQPELAEWFETQHSRNAELLCRDLDADYFSSANFASLEQALESFWKGSDSARVLEIFTDRHQNQEFFNKYKNTINGIKIQLGND